ncbi:MAG: hypothetical protein IJT83_10685 [Victivallales bacterium]|nr:hypothetical protein [Victivallales bacterium]
MDDFSSIGFICSGTPIECPALRHLRKLGMEPSPHICLQTIEVNAGMCEDTPWSSEVKLLEEGHCIQTFRKEARHDSK